MNINPNTILNLNLNTEDFNTYINFNKDKFLLSKNTHLIESMCRNQEDLYSLKMMRVNDETEKESYLILKTDFETKIYQDAGDNILVDMVQTPEILEKFKNPIKEITYEISPINPDPRNCYLFSAIRYENISLEKLNEKHNQIETNIQNTANLEKNNELFEEFKKSYTSPALENYGKSNRDFYFLLDNKNELSSNQINNLYAQLKKSLGRDLGIDLNNEHNGRPYVDVDFEKYMKQSAAYYEQIRGITDRKTADSLFSSIDAKVAYPRYFRTATHEICQDIKQEKNYNSRSLDGQALFQTLATIREHVAAEGDFDFSNFKLEPITVSPNKIKVAIYEGPENDLNITTVNCSYRGNYEWKRNLEQLDRNSEEYYACTKIRNGQKENDLINNKIPDNFIVNRTRNSFTINAENNEKKYEKAINNYRNLEEGKITVSKEDSYDTRAELEKLAEIKGINYNKEKEYILNKD